MSTPINQASQISVIAEMACAHGGDASAARRLVDVAGQAKADAVQLQIWEPDELVVPHHPDLPLLLKLKLEKETWREIIHYSRTRYPELEVWACIYGTKSLAACEQWQVDGYKIHASDLTNRRLLEACAETAKPINLSVGASEDAEITRALGWLEAGASKVRLMHGHQNFPTPSDEAHLRNLLRLREKFQIPVGYQDHCDGDEPTAFWLPAAALGVGADCLEKHVTLDRLAKGTDYEAALDPEAFFEFVRMVRQVTRALLPPNPKGLERYRQYAKRGLVASRDLPAGHRIENEDIALLRCPSSELAPAEEALILGKVLNASVPAFFPFSLSKF